MMKKTVCGLLMAFACCVMLLCGVSMTAPQRVSRGVYGDVNGDGVADIDDLNAIINVMLHKNADASIEVRADIDGNGMIDIDDLNVVINVMLGKTQGGTVETRIYTVNGVSFKMIAVEGGTFTMGATAEQGTDAVDLEFPAHEVTLSSFTIGETEVTQALWQAVMGNNPSYFNGYGNSDVGSYHSGEYYGTNLKRPVEWVSWNDCQQFISKLNELTGATFRLPTEAEWEFAARGGNKSKGYKYAGSNNIDEVAWYYENRPSQTGGLADYGTQTVATKSPNELGLYDMSGNVWEWCQDWYGRYSSEPQTNPTGPETGSDRVDRGGSWGHYAMYCRVSTRSYWNPVNRSSVGFRLAQ